MNRSLTSLPSLAFAVGIYLPISTSAPIFLGGIVRYLVDIYLKRKLAAHRMTIRAGHLPLHEVTSGRERPADASRQRLCIRWDRAECVEGDCAPGAVNEREPAQRQRERLVKREREADGQRGEARIRGWGRSGETRMRRRRSHREQEREGEERRVALIDPRAPTGTTSLHWSVLVREYGQRSTSLFYAE